MTEHICIGPRAWGRGWSEYSAVENYASNAEIDEETITVELIEVETDADWHLQFGSFRVEDADDVVSEETLELQRDDLQKVADLAGQVELAAEEALVEAEEVE